MYSDTSDACVKITTGTGPNEQGFLKVAMGDGIIADGYFNSGVVVINTCYKGLESMEITCPNVNDGWADGWAGTIKVTVDGKSKSIYCSDCTGSHALIDEHFVVDGDSNLPSKTQCYDAATCTLSWEGNCICCTPS